MERGCSEGASSRRSTLLHNLRHTFAATMYFNEVDNKNPEPWLLIKELLGTPAWKPPEIFT